MRRFAVVACAFCLLGVGMAPSAHSAYASGKVLQVIGASELGKDIFINYLKSAGEGTFSGGLPTQLNADYYPKKKPTNAIYLTMSVTNFSDYIWELSWSGTTALAFSDGTPRLQTATGTDPTTGQKLIGDPHHCWRGNNAVVGTDCDLTLKATTVFRGWGSIQIVFPNNQGPTINLSNMVLLRTKDKVAFQAGEIFTPEFINVLNYLNPAAIRTLGLTFPDQVNEFEGKWSVRTPLTALTYGAATYPPSIWAGAATKNGYDQYVTGSYPNMPRQWTDGEVFQADMVSAPPATATMRVTAVARDASNGEVQVTVNTTATLSNGQLAMCENCQNTPAFRGISFQGPVTVIDATHADLNAPYTAASFTGSVSGQRLTVTGVASGGLKVNQIVLGTNATSTTWIASQNSGIPGGAGTYTLSNSHASGSSGKFTSSEWGFGGTGYLHTTTIDVGGRGPKFLVPSYIHGAPYITTTNNHCAPHICGTMYYDGYIDAVLYSPSPGHSDGGLDAGLPPEILTALANKLNKPLWWNIPPFYHTADIAAAVAYFRDHLIPDLYLEYNNENWNTNQEGQYFFALSSGIGIPSAGGGMFYNASAFKIRQLFAAATTAWAPRALSHLHRVLGVQTATGASTAGPNDFEQNLLTGMKLCGTSCGNSEYQSKVGVDYNVAPNRPIDFADAIAVTTYVGCDQCQGPGTGSSLAQLLGSCDGKRCTGIVDAARCYANPSDDTCGSGGTAQLALDFLDNNMRHGGYANGTYPSRQTKGGLDELMSVILLNWSKLAAKYNLDLIAYEGAAPDNETVSGAHLCALGDPKDKCASDSNAIAALFEGYRRDHRAYQFAMDWQAAWAAVPRTTYNSWLTIFAWPPSTGLFCQPWCWNVKSGTSVPYERDIFFQSYYALHDINSMP